MIVHGSVKLPSIKEYDIVLAFVGSGMSDEMGASTFKELGSGHKNILRDLSIDEYLTPKLHNIAKNLYSYEGDLSNQYHIARKVEPGNTKEMFRAHFDSHLFTMVLPIRIPETDQNGTAGDLIYFPHARKVPANAISNFIGTAYYKRFASKKRMEKFSLNHKKRIDNFKDYQPLLFVGNTTLHTNFPVSLECSGYRLTLLAHFFDPSPKYGVGGLLRLLRNR